MKTGSKAFERARKKAETILKDPEKTRKIVDSAINKASTIKTTSQFQEISGKFQALVRMIRSYINKEYREIPWQTIVLGITAIVYFVTPFDAIFDLIPLLGFADDVAILTAVFSSINHELDKFIQWENERVAETEPEGISAVEADFEEVQEG